MATATYDGNLVIGLWPCNQASVALTENQANYMEELMLERETTEAAMELEQLPCGTFEIPKPTTDHSLDNSSETNYELRWLFGVGNDYY